MTVGAPNLSTVVIDSVTVDAYLLTQNGAAWVEDMNNDNSTIRVININLSRGINSALDISSLDQKYVTVQRGVSSATEEYVFRGYIIKVVPDGGVITLTCADKLYASTKVKVTTSFDINVDTEAGVYSEIFKTLVNNYSGLSCNSTTVQDSGTTMTIKRFVCRSAVLFERLKTIADTLGWQFYYDPVTDLVYLEPFGYTNQATSIISGVNLVNTPKWERDSTNLFTKVEVQGAYQEVQTTESGRIGVTTGYSTTYIQLTQPPLSTKVYVDAVNPPTTLRTGGKTGSTSVFDYSVDPELNRIVWNTTQYTPLANDYAQVDYSYPAKTPVVLQDDAAHALYDPIDASTLEQPWKEKVLHKYDITEVSDAENYGQTWLDNHKAPILKTTARVVNVSDLQVGQTIYVNDTYNAISGYFYATRVVKRFPYKYDEVELVSNIIDDDNKMSSWEVRQRVKRLEEINSNDSETLLHVFSQVATIPYRARYMYMEKRSYVDAVGVFILGHPKFAILGTDKLGDDQNPAWTTYQLVQGNNVYRELATDTDFYDGTASTGVTWNTTARTVTVAGRLVSSKIALGKAYSFVTATIASASGDYLIEISGDGGTTWQEVTSGVRTSINVSDTTGVMYRIQAGTGTEGGVDWGLGIDWSSGIDWSAGGGGTGVIFSNTYKASGATLLPLLRIVLEE